MEMIKNRMVLASLFIALMPLPHMAQTASRQNLTAMLNQLAKDREVIISFSPNLTDRLYPRHISDEGEVSDVLRKLLAGQNLSFKRVKDGLYYVYAPQKVTARAKPLFIKQKVCDALPPVPPVTLPASVPATGGKKKLPVAIKSNVLYDATLTLNLGVEFALAPKWTLDLSANYNGWAYTPMKQLKHFLFQPEARYWTGKRYESFFWGIHTHYATYDVSKLAGMDYRYRGWLLGAGATYGKQWRLAGPWRIEAAVGVGYSYLNRDKYFYGKGGMKLSGDRPQHYVGVDKLAVSIVYLIK